MRIPLNGSALHHGHRFRPRMPGTPDRRCSRLILAIVTTSAGVAAGSHPDGGVVPSREMIEAVARIVRAVQVPVTADIEHAYAATPDAVAEVVMRIIAAGAVGINLEDYVPGADDLEPLALQVGKITTILKSTVKAGVRIVVNARTDIFLRGLGAPDARWACHRARQSVSCRRRRLRVRPRGERSRDDRRHRQRHRRAGQRIGGRRHAAGRGA
jgi:hypothetical protein